MVHGLILSILLIHPIYPLTDNFVEASICGGYYIEGFYGTVEVETIAKPSIIGISYQPLNIMYDFRVGWKWQGFDIAISRHCEHGIDRYIEGTGGFSLMLKWSTLK
jgi:hypothetical protein